MELELNLQITSIHNHFWMTASCSAAKFDFHIIFTAQCSCVVCSIQKEKVTNSNIELKQLIDSMTIKVLGKHSSNTFPFGFITLNEEGVLTARL